MPDSVPAAPAASSHCAARAAFGSRERTAASSVPARPSSPSRHSHSGVESTAPKYTGGSRSAWLSSTSSLARSSCRILPGSSAAAGSVLVPWYAARARRVPAARAASNGSSSRAAHSESRPKRVKYQGAPAARNGASGAFRVASRSPSSSSRELSRSRPSGPGRLGADPAGGGGGAATTASSVSASTACHSASSGLPRPAVPRQISRSPSGDPAGRRDGQGLAALAPAQRGIVRRGGLQGFAEAAEPDGGHVGEVRREPHLDFRVQGVQRGAQPQGDADGAGRDGPGLQEFDGGILGGALDAADESADPEHAAGGGLDRGRFRGEAVDGHLGPAQHPGVAVQQPGEPVAGAGRGCAVAVGCPAALRRVHRRPAGRRRRATAGWGRPRNSADGEGLAEQSCAPAYAGGPGRT